MLAPELTVRREPASFSVGSIDRIPDEVPAILKMNVSDPGRFADLAATNMNFRIADKDEVLQRLDVIDRATRQRREVWQCRFPLVLRMHAAIQYDSVVTPA